VIYGLDILQRAGNLITGDRAKTHGSFIKNHENIANLFSGYLDEDINSLQALLMMALLKIARTKEGDFNIDDFIDACGYIALAGQLASKEHEDEQRKKNLEELGLKHHEDTTGII
tara:strand:+ start:1496 stop:1840 length:345 start_codon:yes stop_codon:yes gene_type:complete